MVNNYLSVGKKTILFESSVEDVVDKLAKYEKKRELLQLRKRELLQLKKRFSIVNNRIKRHRSQNILNDNKYKISDDLLAITLSVKIENIEEIIKINKSSLNIIHNNIRNI